LIANTTGLEISGAGFNLRVSNVPLFRNHHTTGLVQAVRIRSTPPEDPAEVIVRISGPAGEADHVTLPADAVASEFLFVPEVQENFEFLVEVLRDGRVVDGERFLVTPQRKWTIHLVHHSHYDIGYTDPQALVLESQLAFIDDALELATITDDWRPNDQFRWSIEVNWPLRHWLRTRSRHARDELIRRIKSGRIEINALPFSMHTEAYSFDELARQFDYTQQLRDELGVEITTAMQTDVPGSTIGLSTLLTDGGVRYLAVAHNYAGRSIPHLLDGQDLTRPFWWQAPDGDKVLVWYTDTLHGSAYMEAMTIGFGDGYDDVVMSLPEYLNALAQRNYPYGSGEDWISGSLRDAESSRAGYPHDLLHMRVQGAFGDNGPASLLPATIVREWNERWAYPRLVSSTNRSFFDEAEKRLGPDLATYSGDWTDWWADGIGSSAAMLAKNRASQSDIRTGQTLNALAHAMGDPTPPETVSEVTTAYEEMALFDEHTWGAADPWGTNLEMFQSGEHEWIRKAGFALGAEERVNLLLHGGMERLSTLGNGKAGARQVESIVVVNPNSWDRTDLVRAFIPKHAWPTTGADLVEIDSGLSIPFVVDPQVHPRHRPMGVWIRFLARNVPSIGMLRFELRESSQQESENQSQTIGNVIKGEHFDVELDLERGAIGSIVDRGTGRQLVNADAPFGFNAYIHDRYTSGTGFNHLSSRMGRAQPWLLGARGTGQFGLITSQASNAVFDQVTYRYSAQGVDWIEATLTLPRGVPRLHIENHLHKPSTMEKESVYFAFPFGAPDPALTFEITGGTAGPDSPHVPGSARHFRAIRHWATIEESGRSPIAWATRQTPLVQTGNIHLPYAPFPTTLPADQDHGGTIYSWALNNIWDTNFPARQGGELRFDYVLATGHSESGDALGRDTGASASQPLVGIRMRSGADIDKLPARGSFVSIDDPRIELTHLSTNHAGSLVVYLESHANESVDARLTLPGIEVSSARCASFLGTDATDAPVVDNGVSVTIAAGEIRTVVLDLAQ
jgi:hypothetical protein